MTRAKDDSLSPKAMAPAKADEDRAREMGAIYGKQALPAIPDFNKMAGDIVRAVEDLTEQVGEASGLVGACSFLVFAGEELLRLHDIKQRDGKTEEYLRLKGGCWARLRTAIEIVRGQYPPLRPEMSCCPACGAVVSQIDAGRLQDVGALLDKAWTHYSRETMPDVRGGDYIPFQAGYRAGLRDGHRWVPEVPLPADIRFDAVKDAGSTADAWHHPNDCSKRAGRPNHDNGRLATFCARCSRSILPVAEWEG